MRHVFATSVLALSPFWLVALAGAAEGRLSDIAPPTLDATRVSSYSSAAAAKDAPPSLTPKTQTEATKGVVSHASKRIARNEKRSASMSLSPRSGDFYLYDAGSVLITDRDGDAYHSEFRIRFDADAIFGDALVYAKLYVRRVGDIDWSLYHTTEDFWIYGQSATDDYYVTTTLDDGFPTAEYDVLIDLYESGYSGIVATIGPNDSGALAYLPLEEAGLDVPAEIPGYQILGVTTLLLIDSDQDGHYSQFRVTFDPDADFDGTFAYARVWVRPQGGTWIEEHVSDDFPVDASGTADLYSFTADWISGYPTAHYDIQIDLHDSATSALLASAGSERPELSRLPLEDQSKDRYINPPGTGTGGSSTSHEHGGGGALTAWWMLGLLLIAIGRRLRTL